MTLYNHHSEVEGWRWPSFSPAEIACRGTGEILVHEDALDRLQRLREQVGKPLIVNSAYRSEKHNRKVGGAKNSQHRLGTAFDISIANHAPDVLEAQARGCGFNGIGRYPTFIHIDVRDRPATFGPLKAWPLSDGFAKEPERKPLPKSRIIQGNGVAFGGGGSLAMLTIAQEMADKAVTVKNVWHTVESLGPWLWVGIAAVVLGVGYAVYARIDDRRKGRN